MICVIVMRDLSEMMEGLPIYTSLARNENVKLEEAEGMVLWRHEVRCPFRHRKSS